MSKKTRNILIALAVVLCAALVILFNLNGGKQAAPAATEAPVAEVAEETKEAAEETAETVTETAEAAVEEAKETVAETAETVTGTAEAAVEEVKETVADAAETVTGTAEAAVEEAKETVTEAAETVAETVTDAVEGAKETVAEAAGDAKEIAEEAAKTVADTVTETVAEAAETVTETAGAAVTAAAGAAGEAAETVAETAKEITEGAAETVAEAAEEVVETAEVAETVTEAAEEVAEGAAETVAEAAEEVVENAEAAADAETPEIMVTVNGKVVTRDEYNEVFESLRSYYSNAGYQFTTEDSINTLKAASLNNAIVLELIDQKAVEFGLDTFTDEEEAAMHQEAAGYMAGVVDSYMNYYGLTPAEDASEEDKTAARTNAVAALEALGVTESYYYEAIRSNEIYDRVRGEVIKDIQASDEDIQNAFDAQVENDRQLYDGNVSMYEYNQYFGQKSYFVPEGYRGVLHILLNVEQELLDTYQDLQARFEEQQEASATDLASPTDAEATATDTEASPTDLVTQEDVDAAYAAIIASVQPTIDEINRKLADGAAFEDLIAEYGKDPGMQDEATLRDGYSVHRDSILWDPAFIEAAFSVDNVGDVAAPVVGNYGVHLVKYHRDVPAGAVELTDEIRAELAEGLVGDAQAAAFDSAVEAWMDSAEIVYSAEAQAIMDAVMSEEATPTDVEATATDAE